MHSKLAAQFRTPGMEAAVPSIASAAASPLSAESEEKVTASDSAVKTTTARPPKKESVRCGKANAVAKKIVDKAKESEHVYSMAMPYLQELLAKCTLMSQKTAGKVKSAAKILQEAKVSLPTAPEASISSSTKIVNQANRKATSATRKAPSKRNAKSSPSTNPPAKKPSIEDVVAINTAKGPSLLPERDTLSSLDKIGTITDSPADGNCGFHASKAVLEAKGFIQTRMNVVEFRKSIHDFAVENKALFIGDSSSYLGLDGSPPPVFNPTFRSSRSATKSVESHFLREIGCVYKTSVKYLPVAASSHWMSDAVVLPILAFKYCITMVSYVGLTPAGEDSGKKCRPKNTLIFRYDKKNRKVILEEHRGWVKPPPESACIVGNGDDHFQWIKPTTCT